MKKKLAIIGAGIAGLTLANFLKKFTAHEFMVYEKEESLSLEEGYGIQLAVNSIEILNQIDFKKINKENLFNPKILDFYNIQNEKICDLDLTKFNTNETKYTTLQRSTLIEFLKEDIYTQHLRFGKKIKEVSELKEKILIKFEDNTNDLVDYVKTKLQDGSIEMGHARAVLSLDSSLQETIIKNAVIKRLSVRAVEALARNSRVKNVKKSNDINQDTVALEKDLSEHLAADIKISHKSNGTGKLEIKYKSLNELQGIVAKFKK